MSMINSMLNSKSTHLVGSSWNMLSMYKTTNTMLQTMIYLLILSTH